MAEFLIHLGRGDPLDPADYQPGDVVEVQADGTRWSRGIASGHWCVILKVPDLPLAVARRAVASEEKIFIDAAGEQSLRLTRKRLWRLHLDEMPTNVSGALRANGEVTLNISQVKAFCRHKLDGRTLDQA